ncbi:MAG: HAMP domain-containing histidine kinase [Clostridiales bacterium]|nr:HAMP domain-containing histidine kinase [Clostridiales bacterium]
MFKLRSLKKRWMLNSVLIMLMLSVVGMSAYGIAIFSYYYTGIQTALEAKAKSATDFFTTYIAQTSAGYYQSAYQYTEKFDERNYIELQFVDSQGRVEVSTYGITAGTKPGTPDIYEAISSRKLRTWRGKSPSTGERIIAVSSPMIHPNGQVLGLMRYVSSLKLVDRIVLINMLGALGVSAGLTLIVALFNLYFIRGIVTPIKEVTVMTKRIAEGGYGGQISKNYTDEIGMMVDTINDMSIKLSQSEKLKNEFVSSVSHELRTPLTAITGWAETILYDEGMSEDSHLGVGIILTEARRLSGMVEELLDFTRIEDGHFKVNIEPMDIEAELEEAIITYGELLRHEEIELQYEASPEPIPMINGDTHRLKQVFLNILDNAAKYGREQKRIIVSIRLRKNYADTGRDYVDISVRDFGPGVPPDELQNIKYKFYKGSSKERGNGIGLAVCDEIVRLHDGLLLIENAPGGGLLVSIMIPMDSSATAKEKNQVERKN